MMPALGRSKAQRANCHRRVCKVCRHAQPRRRRGARRTNTARPPQPTAPRAQPRQPAPRRCPQTRAGRACARASACAARAGCWPARARAPHCSARPPASRRARAHAPSPAPPPRPPCARRRRWRSQAAAQGCTKPAAVTAGAVLRLAPAHEAKIPDMLGAPPAGDAPCSVWHRRSPARATGVADRTPSRCRDACALAGGGADADEHVVAHIRGRDAQVARLRHQGATRRLYPAQPALMHDCHGRANVLLKFLRQHSPATRCATENCWPSPRSAALLQHRWCDIPPEKPLHARCTTACGACRGGAGGGARASRYSSSARRTAQALRSGSWHRRSHAASRQPYVTAVGATLAACISPSTCRRDRSTRVGTRAVLAHCPQHAAHSNCPTQGPAHRAASMPDAGATTQTPYGAARPERRRTSNARNRAASVPHCTHACASDVNASTPDGTPAARMAAIRRSAPAASPALAHACSSAPYVGSDGASAAACIAWNAASPLPTSPACRVRHGQWHQDNGRRDGQATGQRAVQHYALASIQAALNWSTTRARLASQVSA